MGGVEGDEGRRRRRVDLDRGEKVRGGGGEGERWVGSGREAQGRVGSGSVGWMDGGWLYGWTDLRQVIDPCHS